MEWPIKQSFWSRIKGWFVQYDTTDTMAGRKYSVECIHSIAFERWTKAIFDRWWFKITKE